MFQLPTVGIKQTGNRHCLMIIFSDYSSFVHHPTWEITHFLSNTRANMPATHNLLCSPHQLKRLCYILPSGNSPEALRHPVISFELCAHVHHIGLCDMIHAVGSLWPTLESGA